MTPQLYRAMYPMQLGWQINRTVSYLITIHASTLNLVLATYLESLALSGLIDAEPPAS